MPVTQDSTPGMFSQADIQRELRNGPDAQVKLTIDGKAVDSHCERVTYVGYDVTLSDREKRQFDLTANKFLETKKSSEGTRYIEVKPGHTVSIETAERITLGCQVGGLVQSKVRMVSRGFSHISTTVDPCWDGELLLTFTNFAPRKLRIIIGTPVATLVLFRQMSACDGTNDAHEDKNAGTWKDYDASADEAGKSRLRAALATLVLSLLGLLSFGFLVLIKIYPIPPLVDLYNGLPELWKNLIMGLVIAAIGGAFASVIAMARKWLGHYAWGPTPGTIKGPKKSE